MMIGLVRLYVSPAGAKKELRRLRPEV
jgi:hypothetical protein